VGVAIAILTQSCSSIFQLHYDHQCCVRSTFDFHVDVALDWIPSIKSHLDRLSEESASCVCVRERER